MTAASRLTDSRGHELGTRSSEAAERYNLGIDLFLSGTPGALPAWDAAVEADGGFALGHAARAQALQLAGKIPDARTAAQRAQELSEETTKRERGHIAALMAAVGGDTARAAALATQHLSDFPSDVMVLSLAGRLVFFNGARDRAEQRVQMVDDVAHAFGADDWAFLSMRAFAYHEVFRLEQSRAFVERSLQLRRENYNAAHSMAHVDIESDQMDGGSAFLDGWLPQHDRAATLYGHLAWHLALFELARGDYGRVMEIYEQDIRAGVSTRAAMGVVMDSASLLWRCELFGEGIAGEGEFGAQNLPWEAVSELSAEAFPKVGNAFMDVHSALAFAASGEASKLGTLIDDLKSAQAEGRLPAGEVIPRLAEGIAAFAAGDFDTTISLLRDYEDDISRVGGSHAQWQVFEDTLLEAYLRGGQPDLAEALLRKRIARQPSSRDLKRLEAAFAGNVDIR